MIILTDTDFLIHRTLHLPEYFGMNYNNIPTGGIFGVIKALHSTLSSTYYARLKIAIFDGHKSSRRLKLYPEYKGNRKPKTDQEKQFDQEYFSSYQLQKTILMHKALPLLGILPVHFPSKEGDDVIYKVIELNKDEDQIFLISEDNDLLQLIHHFPNLVVYQPIKKRRVDKDNFKEVVGVVSSLFLIRKAISGDKSDNIKGIPGIGEVTAQKVADNLDPLKPTESLLEYAKLHKDSGSRLAKIYSNWSMIARNLELIDISREEFLPSDVESLKNGIKTHESRLYRDQFRDMCHEYGFNSILKNFDSWIFPFQIDNQTP